MTVLLQPRRFSEVWQSDAEWPGTIEQQRAVREALSLIHGSDCWRLMKRLDQSANQVYRRAYLTVGFPPDDMWPENMLAVAGITGINMRASYALGAIPHQLRHELGHVVDKHLLTQSERVWFMHVISGEDLGNNKWAWSYQETFADAVRDWWISEGTVWPELTAVLLP